MWLSADGVWNDCTVSGPSLHEGVHLDEMNYGSEREEGAALFCHITRTSVGLCSVAEPAVHIITTTGGQVMAKA